MKTVKNILVTVSITFITLACLSFVLLKKAYTNTETSTGFALIELFTSEGCSSCPPADALVAKIEKETSGKPIYILAYHVDYWNRLGWKDPYSSAKYSERQNTYAEWLHLQGVYTPQILVNGQIEFVGSGEGNLRKAIDRNLQTPAAPLKLHITGIQSQYAEIQYNFISTSKSNRLFIACVEKNASTKVLRGENDGRILKHVNVVRSLQEFPAGGGEEHMAKVSLPNGFAPKSWEMIGFIQDTATGTIISATKADNNLIANTN